MTQTSALHRYTSLDAERTGQTPRMQELRRLVIDDFRPTGRACGKTWDMPIRNIEQLHERGWLRTAVSEALGGAGSTLDDADKATYVQAIRTLAYGCPSTAHCFQVHMHATWIIEKIGTPWQIDRYLKPALRDGRLIGFVGSEAKRRSQYMVNTKAKRVAGGWRVTGEKNYATNASYMGAMIATAAIDGVDNPLENHLMMLIDDKMEGITVDPSWYRPAGMRAADSPIIVFDNVFVPDEQILGQPGEYPRGRWQGRYHLGFAANYLGATEGMFDWFIEYMKLKDRTKDNILHLRTGEIRIELEATRALFHRAIAAWAEGDIVQAELLSIAAKSTAAHMAFNASHKIIHAAGSTSLFEEYPLATYLADLHTHVLHAVHDKSAQTLGLATLGERFDSTTQR